jgi:hypothetical protein
MIYHPDSNAAQVAWKRYLTNTDEPQHQPLVQGATAMLVRRPPTFQASRSTSMWIRGILDHLLQID